MKDDFAHRAAEWDSPEKVRMTEVFVAQLFQKIQIQPHWKALEVGAGTGLVGMQLLNNVSKIVFEDTSAAMLDVLKNKLENQEKVEILLGEVFEYNHQDIDFVFSCMAFHHIPDIGRTLRHLYSISNDNATIAIADLVEEDGSFHSFEPIPHKGFDVEKLSVQFKDAGFEVQSISIYNTLKRERVKGVIGSYDQFVLIARKL
jgi:ubiquinone/menaquinone biosynthesis C-methylase UbiE